MNSQSTTSELRGHFDRVDRDGNGRIDLDEFRDLLKTLGMNRSGPVVEHAFGAIDADGSGSIDFKEFSHWWERSAPVSAESRQLSAQRQPD